MAEERGAAQVPPPIASKASAPSAWTCERQDDDNGEIYWAIHDAQTYAFIANVYSNARHGRLIAAAPDLLMVSAWLLRLIEAPELKRGTEAHDEHRMELRLACDATRAAIARAEGK
jgi:hypothetical protein